VNRSAAWALPDAAASFAGLIAGKVLANRGGQLLLHVEQVTRVWEHSRASRPERSQSSG
jgi:hypothetical protein